MSRDDEKTQIIKIIQYDHFVSHRELKGMLNQNIWLCIHIKPCTVKEKGHLYHF